MGFPGSTVAKNPPTNAGAADVGSIPGNPLQAFCLGNPMDREACTVHGVAKSQTRLSDRTWHGKLKFLKFTFLQLPRILFPQVTASVYFLFILQHLTEMPVSWTSFCELPVWVGCLQCSSVVG